MVCNHSYRNRRDKKEERSKNDSLTQVEGEKRGNAQEASTASFGVKNEWGELSFYRQSSERKGVTWGSIHSDPQVTTFSFLSDTRFVLDRVASQQLYLLRVTLSDNDKIIN